MKSTKGIPTAPTEEEDPYEWLGEQLKTIINLCDVGLILWRDRTNRLLPTVLETILQEAQGVVDEYCVVKEKNG